MSNRSLFILGVNRYSLIDNIRLEANVEQAYLLSKETILLGDFNIDALSRSKFNKRHHYQQRFEDYEF